MFSNGFRFNSGGSVSLSGKNGASTHELTIAIPHGGQLVLSPLFITNPTYLVHYTVTLGAAATAPANLAACQGHMAYVAPGASVVSLADRVFIPLPNQACCVNLFVTDNTGASQNGGANDYIQYQLFSM
jgi:hypothetical protein